MSPDIRGTAERAAGWLLAIGLVAVKTVEWAVLGPYRTLRTYLNVGEKRQEEAAKGESAGGDGSEE